MKIKIKKDCQIPEKSGWCFWNYGTDEDLIAKINEGKIVEVDKIPPKAFNYVTEQKKKKKD